MFCHSNPTKFNLTNFKQKSSISNIEKISSHWCYDICGVIINIIPARRLSVESTNSNKY